jgi:8-amino-7-oxononanoate synthase
MSAFDWLADRESERVTAGLRRHLAPRGPGDDGLIDLASNDYLGLSRDPRVTEAAAEAARTWGGGSTGSRLVTGSTRLHADLEAALAGHVGTAAALVFSSGYLANLGAVAALAGPGTLVVSDAQNHASVIDACRVSRARVVVVPHRDVQAVRVALAERVEARALVVTDAVFSVDGEAAPLLALHEVARAHRAALVVDEAHALGVVGEGGVGLAASLGLAGEPDVVLTVTLSKALGSQGGAVLGRAAVVDHLVDAARPFIFDTGLAPAAAGAALAALDVLSREPWLAEAARDRAADLARVAATAGLRRSAPDAAVVGIRIGSPEAAVTATAVCAAHGVRVGCFRPPSVPDGVSRLRLAGRADLSSDDLAQVATALCAVAERLQR